MGNTLEQIALLAKQNARGPFHHGDGGMHPFLSRTSKSTDIIQPRMSSTKKEKKGEGGGEMHRPWQL